MCFAEFCLFFCVCVLLSSVCSAEFCVCVPVQRQRLRQLILRQQQQKSALRQEKGLQEGDAGPPASPPGPPRHWSQEDSSTAPPTDPFGRPPPPYPGTVRPVGAAGAPAPRFPGGFPGEQQRGFNTSEAPLPRQSLPREQGVQGPVLR